ncbi:V protein [Mossman virus]|uniref:Non-structural protein V n=1 Tax=Mossman virus TaxID=241630 RepID=Q6WGM4_9MONO|nr:V protein [Mossman virus]AAQ23988.1 V protein [Mossman virus]
METNCQKDIKNALQILAVAKETQSPKSEEELRERLDISGVTTTASTDTVEAESQDRSEKEPGSGRSGEEQQSSASSSSVGFTQYAEGDGDGVSDGGANGSISTRVFYSTVCENNPDESLGRSSCYVMLGKAGGIEPVPNTAGDRESTRSNQLGEDDDAGQSGLTSARALESGTQSDEPVVKPKRKNKKSPMNESAVDENMREEDIKEAFGMNPQPRARRLTGLEAAASTLPSIVVHKEQTKRGHRREYNFVWTDSGFRVEAWCNPICSRIRNLPRREKCRCGWCPKECPECALGN